MSRWEPEPAARLERAALELFAEQGYAATTVPQIAARAGLTTRTFFRHFADKREVLFLYEAELPQTVHEVIAAQPEGVRPVDLMTGALVTVMESRFTPWRGYLTARRAIVQQDAGLRERELLKLSVLTESIRLGMLDRGVDDNTAALLAPMGTALFDLTLNRWLDDPTDRPLVDELHDTLAAFRAVLER